MSLLLAAAIVALYSRTVGFGYVFDDAGFIVRNPGLAKGWTWEGVRWAFTASYHANWHPVTWLAHLADRALFGLRPGPAHLVNTLLHASGAALLLLTLRRLTGALWPSAFAAALFALHPLRVESVAWVTERKDALSLIFCLLATKAYLRSVRRPGPGRLLVLPTALFALGLMTKPSVVTFPFILLLLDGWPLGRLGHPGRRGLLLPLVIEKIPLLLPAIAVSVVTAITQSEAGALRQGMPIANPQAQTASLALDDAAMVRPWEQYPPEARLGNAVVSYAAYLGKTIWPTRLAAYYPHPGDTLSALRIAGAGLVLVLLTLGALRETRRRPWLAVGWLWYLGTLVPMIGIVQAGMQAMADRYTYLPSIGIALGVSWEAAQRVRRSPRAGRALIATGAATLVVLAALSLQQTGYWRDDRTLFEHALAVTGENPLVHFELGILDGDAGRAAAAEAHYREAIRILPNFAEAHVNLGALLAAQGQFKEAAVQYQRALRIKPTSAEAHLNFGALLDRQGARLEAIAHFREALRSDPGLAIAHMNLANTLSDLGRREAALAEYAAALQLDPNDPLIPFNRGLTLEQMGRGPEAAAAYRETLRLSPEHAEARRGLERLSRSLGR